MIFLITTWRSPQRSTFLAPKEALTSQARLIGPYPCHQLGHRVTPGSSNIDSQNSIKFCWGQLGIICGAAVDLAILPGQTWLQAPASFSAVLRCGGRRCRRRGEAGADAMAAMAALGDPGVGTETLGKSVVNPWLKWLSFLL